MGKILKIRDALKDDTVALERANKLAKGAQPGHPFYGNQYTDGEGGGESKSDSSKEGGGETKGGVKGKTYTYKDEKEKQSLVNSASLELTKEGYTKGQTTSKDIGIGLGAASVTTTVYSHRDGSKARMVVGSGSSKLGQNFVRVDRNYLGDSKTKKSDEPDDLTKIGDGSNQYTNKGGVENVKAHLESDGRNATFETKVAAGKTAKDEVVKVRTEAHEAMRAKGFLGKIKSATIDSVVHEFQHQFDGRVATSQSSWGKEPSVKITITHKGSHVISNQSSH